MYKGGLIIKDFKKKVNDFKKALSLAKNKQSCYSSLSIKN